MPRPKSIFDLALVRTTTWAILCGGIVFGLMLADGIGIQQPSVSGPLAVSTVANDGEQDLTAQTASSRGASTRESQAEPEVPQNGSAAPPTESALKSIFSPARAPERRTMGLLQRTFLDVAADGDRELELAVVVDGTDSMSAELAGVRRSIHQMLDDLRKYRQGEVRMALVIYRDAASPSGAVEVPLDRFTADDATIEQAVQRLTPESGAPYFHELPDLGLYRAITDLPWSADDQVTKWILLFGDAPPYSDSRSDKAASEGKRRYGDQLLIGAAMAKGIQIHCILCTSGEEVSQAYQTSLDQTRSFMSRLASDTSGLMLDLSQAETRDALTKAARIPDLNYAEIRPITAADLASVRREETSGNDAREPGFRQVRLAVLPHMPLEQIRMSGIDPALTPVQVSTALRTRLAQIAGVRVASPVDIQRQLRRLRLGVAEPTQTIRGLAARLGVDYIVWGEAAPQAATYQTAAYRRDTGDRVVQVELPAGNDQGTWAQLLLTAASEQAGENEAIGQLLDQLGTNNTLRGGLAEPMAQSRTTSAELLKAIEALEQALAYDTRSDQSADLLRTAQAASESAAVAEPNNPLAHWLQANVAYNQAAYRFSQGEVEAATERMSQMKRSLNRAINLRERINVPSLLAEVEADYLLLNRGQLDQAVNKYLELTEPDQPPQSQLRGHWMLSGIFAGDWGAAETDLVDLEKARFHILQILANWPESPQATLLKRWLKFDETTEQTEFNYLPILNVEFTRT